LVSARDQLLASKVDFAAEIASPIRPLLIASVKAPTDSNAPNAPAYPLSSPNP